MIPPNSQKSAKSLQSALLCVILLVISSVFISCSNGDFSNLETLPTKQYLENPVDFLGNTYSVKAQIDSQIKWEKEVGRILAVIPEGSSIRLPVFVPDAVGNNIHIGQRFELRVRIEEGGLVYVEALRKY
ncbi:MAG TPA: hypothetical protein DCX06_11645 [Opitutae bacterium]|nr:hypothetical protein [Opitutae bacterium]